MSSAVVDRVLRETEPRVLAAAAIGLVATGLLAGLLYGIKPVWQEYSALKVRYAAAQMRTLEGGEEVAKTIARLETELAVLSGQLYGEAAGVPHGEIESFVIDSLDRISSRHGVRLLGVTPEEPTAVWMFEELPYEVRVEGSYFAIHRWLHDVEEDLRPMVVKHFQLSPSREGGEVVLDMRVVAYRASEENGA